MGRGAMLKDYSRHWYKNFNAAAILLYIYTYDISYTIFFYYLLIKGATRTHLQQNCRVQSSFFFPSPILFHKQHWIWMSIAEYRCILYTFGKVHVAPSIVLAFILFYIYITTFSFVESKLASLDQRGCYIFNSVNLTNCHIVIFILFYFWWVIAFNLCISDNNVNLFLYISLVCRGLQLSGKLVSAYDIHVNAIKCVLCV